MFVQELYTKANICLHLVMHLTKDLREERISLKLYQQLMEDIILTVNKKA